MKIIDSVYGEFCVEEPVLLELINSKPFQRLKKITQYGIPYEYYMYKGFSRYEHSIGVLLLLKKFNADLEEQIAGLVHDISHPAFSHVVDWMVGNHEKEDYQDSVHSKFLAKSDISTILKKYDFDINSIADLKNFRLLDKEIPEVCADRLDYALREFKEWANPDIVKECYNSIIVIGDRLVFSKRKTAEDFGRTFLKCQNEHWSGAEAVVRYCLMSDILKYAVDKAIVNPEDFMQDDYFIINKLKKSNDEKILNALEQLSEKIIFENDYLNPEICAKKKFRYVNPEYLEDGKIKRLSENIEEFNALIEKSRQMNEEGVNVRIIRR